MNTQPSRAVREVVKVVPTPSGESLAAVLCEDGTYAILRDGDMIESVKWEAHERERCLQFLEHFARTSGGEV
jgi:hypothetical protein